MSTVALQMQYEINGTLRRIDGDIRKFAGCLEKAKVGKGNDDTMEELHALNNKLTQHRNQVRNLTRQAGAQHAKKHMLVDARERIEKEMRRFQDLMKSPDSLGHTSSTENVAEAESEASSEASEAKVMVDQLLDTAGPANEIADEFKCKICMVHMVGCGPVLTECAHLFCGDCMAQWFASQPGIKTWAQRAQSGGSVPCPVCKQALQKERDLHPVCADGDGGSKALYQMLSRTRIMCANSSKCNPDGQCDWIGDYGSYQEHIRLCTNSPVFSYGPLPDAHVVEEVERTESSASIERQSPCESNEMGADDLASEDEHTQHDSAECDTSLSHMGLVGALLEIRTEDKVQPSDIETEDACSTTHGSEQLGSMEPSDEESFEQSESPGASDKHASVMMHQAMLAHEAALQWQMRQYQAAQYQAAQWQMAQWQMAQWQHAQASMQRHMTAQKQNKQSVSASKHR